MVILKTNIANEVDASQILRYLKTKFETEAASIDLEDIDKVLRFVGGGASEADVMETVQSFGYECAPLE